MTLIILTDDALLAHHIESGLAEHCQAITVIGHCYSVEAGMEAINVLKPAVVMLDIGMPKAKKKDILTILTKAGYKLVAITSSEVLFRKLNRQGIPVAMSEPLDIIFLTELIIRLGKTTG